jgi:hypothetical protein
MSRASTISTGRVFMKIGPSSGSLLRIGSSPPSPATMGVSTPVGCTVLTLIRCLASSLAIVREMPTTPCFAAT